MKWSIFEFKGFSKSIYEEFRIIFFRLGNIVKI